MIRCSKVESTKFTTFHILRILSSTCSLPLRSRLWALLQPSLIRRPLVFTQQPFWGLQFLLDIIPILGLIALAFHLYRNKAQVSLLSLHQHHQLLFQQSQPLQLLGVLEFRLCCDITRLEYVQWDTPTINHVRVLFFQSSSLANILDPVPASIGDASSTTAYVCCPTGYGVKISYVSFNSYDTLWPLCTGQATVISSAWRLVPGWPTIQPTSLDLFTTTAIGDYAWFTPLASAMVVAWQSTDSTVIQYLDTARIYLPVP
jgi:hypothetical protein